jgi:hypothetical protein
MAVFKPNNGYTWLPLLVLVALPGCNQQVSPPPQQVHGNDGSRQRPEVKVTVTAGTGYREVLKRQVGQVVLVDFWASW